MTPRKPLPAPASAPLLHWLLLVSGLALVTVLRGDEPEKTVALWLGSVAGTALGQLAARRRLRLWLVAFLTLNLLWTSALLMAPLWAMFEHRLHDPWSDLGLCLQMFVPAVLCGYLALSERGALAGFWFPAILWMVAILDHPGSEALQSARSRLLLAALAALLVAFLHARETRRTALWRGHATVRLARPRPQAVLRVAPLRAAAQLGWAAVLGALALTLTAWIAPHLWQHEKLESREASAPAATTAAGSPEGATESCCPETLVAELPRERVREYLPLLHGHDDDHAMVQPPPSCIACRGGVAIRGDATEAPPTDTLPVEPHAAASAAPAASSPLPGPEPQAAAPVASSPVAPLPAPIPAPTPVPAALTPAPRLAAHPAALPAPAAPADDSPIEGLLELAFLGMALRLALRALRRGLTLRHLGRPFWAETVDQRVSNLWQLMLVGLRDAGWCPLPGEQPQELARRIGLEGMATCATVLDRTRHGVRVDRADLEAMSGAALSVYRAARRRAGGAARAAAWLRWPLV